MTSASSKDAINPADDLHANLLDEENELWQLDRDAKWPEKSVGRCSFASEETNPADYLHAACLIVMMNLLAMGIWESFERHVE